MSRVLTVSDQPATLWSSLPWRRREDARVRAFLQAIAVTGPGDDTVPMALARADAPTAPLDLVAPTLRVSTAPQPVLARRTDTAALPRLVLTAAAQL